MASSGVFHSFLVIKTSQEWERTWYSPWQSRIEAKLHEESKFWRASKPLPNQSSMQGRESEKESNIQQFRNPLRNIPKLANCPRGVQATRQRARSEEWILQPLVKFSQARTNFASLAKLMNFATPWEIFASIAKSSYNLQIFL